MIASLKIDEVNLRWGSGGFGFFSERDDGVMFLGEVIVGNEGGGGTLDTGDFKNASDGAGETEGGIFGRIFLAVSGLVRLVNDDEAEVFNWGE